MVAVVYDIPAAPWSAAERRAWRPAVRLAPSEWAERERYLPAGQTSRPGPWRNRNAPYLVGVMDVVTLPGVRKVSIKKPAQGGFSEAVRNILGCLAVNDPDPALIVLPNEKKGKEIIGERIIPFFNETAVLRELHTEISRDQKLTFIRLTNGFTLWLGWSGSATSLASHPVRLVINDEVNKFAPYAGREADPVALAEQRVKTYESKSLIVNLSTPTTSDGLISQLVLNADVALHYWVPCPDCGQAFQLSWARVRWPKSEAKSQNVETSKRQKVKKSKSQKVPNGTPRPPSGLDHRELASWIEEHKAAWYECPHCDGTFAERQKARVVRKGFWATVEQIERGDHKSRERERERGREGERGRRRSIAPSLRRSLSPSSTAMGAILRKGLPRHVRHVAMAIESMPFLWVKCYDLAAKWLRVQHDTAALMDFVNGDLGRDFEQQVVSSKATVYEVKSGVDWPAQQLPWWTGRLLATCDVQKDHVWVVIRAWGPALRSRRIWHGRIGAPAGDPRGWQELYRRCFETAYPFENAKRLPMASDALGIDSKYRSDEVYPFVATDPRIHAMQGHGSPLLRLVDPRRHTYTPPGEGRSPYDVWYNLVDTGRCKDWLAAAIAADITTHDENGELIECQQWELNSENDPEYNRQLASEHKIIHRRGSARPVERWVPKRESGANNHYWDCEYLQRALAHMMQVELLDYAMLTAAEPAIETTGGLTTPDGRPFHVTDR